jgi:hypothetical protein
MPVHKLYFLRAPRISFGILLVFFPKARRPCVFQSNLLVPATFTDNIKKNNILCDLYFGSWYRPISIATALCIGQPRILGSVPGRDNKFSPLHKVQTDSAVHPTSYRMSAEGCSPGSKAAGIRN